MAPHDSITLALDWTPNTIHTPFLVALGKGFYQDIELDVKLVDPSQDDYTKTPAARLAAGEVSFALAPSESVIAYRYGSNRRTPLRAIAAILHRDASSIAGLHGKVTRPKDLDGKVYASYGARFEDAIVKELIRADGGEGDIEIVKPAKLGIWETLLKGKADATWIFESWEGVEARQKGVLLQSFRMKNFGIPYGYSPLLLENEEKKLPRDVVERFLQATQKGIDFAQENSEESVKVLKEFIPDSDHALIEDSLRLLVRSGAFLPGNRWGIMETLRWSDWVAWLRSKHLLKHNDGSSMETIDIDGLFTNEYLKAK